MTLGTDAEIVRKFVGKMASFCGLPEEEAKLLLQLASNMNRVDEMESKTTTSMELPKVSQKSKRGLFVAVGIHSNFGFNRRGTSTSPPVTMRNVTTTTTTTNSSTNLQQEGMITTSGEGFEMLNSLIEETEQKIQKVKKTLRTKFKKEKRKQSQYPLITGVAEFRGDFGVKTFTGHSEGILAVLCSSQHVISGSW